MQHENQLLDFHHVSFLHFFDPAVDLVDGRELKLLFGHVGCTPCPLALSRSPVRSSSRRKGKLHSVALRSPTRSTGSVGLT